MADITDPRAVTFCNEDLRPLADDLTAAYLRIKRALLLWARPGFSALFPPDASVVVDGSPADGRSPMTGAEVQGFVAFVAALAVQVETPVDGVPPLAVLLAIQVNGTRR